MTRHFALGVRLHVLAASLGPVSAWLSVIAYVAPTIFYMTGHRLCRVRSAGG